MMWLFIKQFLPPCREGVKSNVTQSLEGRKSPILNQGHCSADAITHIYLYCVLTRPTLLGMLLFYPRINAS